MDETVFYCRFHFQPSDVYNMDETGVTTVQTPRSIICETGKKQVGAITSAERGALVTMACTICADGNSIAPFFVFPRSRYHERFVEDGPTGSSGRSTKSGWMNEILYLSYLEHFVKYSRCTTERKVLLILDNHEAHISLKAVELCRDNGIVMLTIPPHTSHRLQPLDKAVFGPFKSYYSRSMDNWIRNHPGKTISIHKIPGIAKSAFLLAMTPRNILSGFHSTGICPFNQDIFSEEDFASSLITDRPMPVIEDQSVATVEDIEESVCADNSISTDASNSAQPAGVETSEEPSSFMAAC